MYTENIQKDPISWRSFIGTIGELPIDVHPGVSGVQTDSGEENVSKIEMKKSSIMEHDCSPNFPATVSVYLIPCLALEDRKTLPLAGN